MDQYYKTVLETLKQWGVPESHALAYGSTLLISLAPFLLLFLVRVENTPQHKNYLRVALSFASGGLLGDAFLHLIPHSMGHSSHDHGHGHGHDDHHHDHHHHEHGHDHEHHDHEHEHEHSHAEEGGHSHTEQTYVGLYIVSGIVLFFLIEKLLHYLKGGSSHSHSHSSGNKKAKLSDSEESDSEELLIKGAKKGKGSPKRKNIKKKASGQVSQTRLVSGLLNLIADFLHNFTDGLAIGATFAAGKSMGAITAFTIFMHEIPHEIGDYAILIQAGYKRSSAMGLQLVTAIGALIGTAVGLYYGDLEHATQLILPVTAGGFIYIATVSVIPELLEKTSSYCQTLMEIGSMFAGLGMMFWIALNE